MAASAECQFSGASRDWTPVEEGGRRGVGWVCLPNPNGNDKRSAMAIAPASVRGALVLGACKLRQQGRTIHWEVGRRRPFRLAACGAKHHEQTDFALTFVGAIGPIGPAIAPSHHISTPFRPQQIRDSLLGKSGKKVQYGIHSLQKGLPPRRGPL